MNNPNDFQKKGISLRAVSIVIGILAGILTIFLLYISYRTSTAYDDLETNLDLYIKSQNDAYSMLQASDYLTQEVRSFAATGNLENLENYFQESDVTRRREKSLESMREYFGEQETYKLLEEAMGRSNELMKIEFYSMRLVIEAKGYDVNSLPEAIQQTELLAEDQALTEEEKLDLAQYMVFDEGYQDYKQQINNDVSECLDSIVAQIQSKQESRSEEFRQFLHLEYIFVILQTILMAAIICSIIFLIIRPLYRSVRHVEKNERLPLSAGYELNYLAQTYNRMLESTREQQTELSYQAQHDALTDLYNRGVFESVRERLRNEDIALILLDIDYFKQLNDQFGHEAGDQALQRLAEALKHTFRSEDYICRIGGDEFAVIMVHANSSMRDLIHRKLEGLNQRVQQAEGSKLPFSLSIGIAFNDNRNQEEDLLKNADKALYQVKERGRKGHEFFR